MWPRDSPNFLFAHRVLGQHGLIPQNWRHTDGTGDPEEATQLLDQDGVEILMEKDGPAASMPIRVIMSITRS